MAPARNKRRTLLLIVARLAIYGLVIVAALKLFLFRSTAQKSFDLTAQDPGGSARLEINHPRTRKLMFGSMTLFEYSVDVNLSKKPIIWIRDGNSFVPGQRTKSTVRSTTNKVEVVVHSPHVEKGTVWLLKATGTMTRKVQIGPARMQFQTPVRFVSGHLTNR